MRESAGRTRRNDAASGGPFCRFATTVVTLIGALSLMALFMTLTSQGADASVRALYVNGSAGHDSGTCSLSSPCASISYALSHAAPDTTIHVAAGTYREQVTITHRVTIVGAGEGATVIAPTVLPRFDSDTDSATPQYYIIDATHTARVDLKNLTVDGSGASSTFTSCADDFVGVYYHDASGQLSNVAVVNVALPLPLFGCQDGLGIYAATNSGTTAFVDMLHLRVQTYDKNGITCDDPGTTCEIVHSTVTGIGPTGLIAQNGIQVFGATAFVLDNHVSGDTYSGGGAGNQADGMLLLNAGRLLISRNTVRANDIDIYAGEIPSYGLVPRVTGTWTIQNNVVTSATDDVRGGTVGNGYGDGIQVDSTTNTVRVMNNKIGLNHEFGTSLFGTTGVLVSGNTSAGNFDGLYVGSPALVQGHPLVAATGNSIVGNREVGNAHDGVLADVTSSEAGNLFRGNSMHKNGFFEAQDLSTGGGTAGTANTWSHNFCGGPHRADPAGIC